MSSAGCIFVMGATAVGKSDFALRLALETGAHLINCDSVQVYQGPKIGSNVPTEDELKSCPHHLYSYVAGPRDHTAGDYRREFFEKIKQLEGQRILVVGGTGFYFQAIEKGMYEPAHVDEVTVRQIESALQIDLEYNKLYEELKLGDPETAARLHYNDRYRVGRAIEVLRSGKKMSDLKKEFESKKFPYPLFKVHLVMERELLRSKIKQRTKKMIERGLVDETKALLSRYSESWSPMKAVGYKQVQEMLDQNLDLSWLEEEISLRTGQLIKRQVTWFKSQPETAEISTENYAYFREACLRFWGEHGKME